MNIFNLKIITLKKYEEEQEQHKKEIQKLKEENDHQFWQFNKQIQEYKTNAEYQYTKKFNHLKEEIKKETKILKRFEMLLETAQIDDGHYIKEVTESYLKLKENILNYKI